MRRAVLLVGLLGLAACASGLGERPRPPLPGGASPSGAAPKEARRSPVSALRFRHSPGEPWRMSPVLPEWTSTVYCTFEVRGLPAGTAVSVVWRRGERELARTDHRTDRTTRSLASELVSDEGLGSGTYDVEVLVDDRSEATTSFRIAGPDQPEPEDPAAAGPRVGGVALSAEECTPAEGRPPRRPARFRLGVEAIHLCLAYDGIRQGQHLEVRWYRSSEADVPLATTTYTPSGSGDLSAAYVDRGELRPGAHHVVILLDGREVARQRFVIDR